MINRATTYLHRQAIQKSDLAAKALEFRAIKIQWIQTCGGYVADAPAKFEMRADLSCAEGGRLKTLRLISVEAGKLSDAIEAAEDALDNLGYDMDAASWISPQPSEATR